MALTSIAAPSALGVGLVVGGIAAAASMQPTISPRSKTQQALITGVSAAGGVGIGMLGMKGAAGLSGRMPGGTLATLGALVAGGIALQAWSNTGDGAPSPTVGALGSAGTIAATVGAAALAVISARAIGGGAARLVPAALAPARTATQALAGPMLLAGGIGALGFALHRSDRTPAAAPSRVAERATAAAAAVAERPVHDGAPPLTSSVTGSSRSGIALEDIGKHGRRFVHEAVSGERIREVMGDGVDPIRVYAGLTSGVNPQARVDVAMADLERLGAFDGTREKVVIATPTGSGFIDPPSIQAAEFMSRGRVATVAIQYANKPSIQSTGEVPVGAETTSLLLQAVNDRIARMPSEARPEVMLFGESLGAWAQQEMFEGRGVDEMARRGVDHALWVGSPHESGFPGEALGKRGSSTKDGALGQFDRIEEIDALPSAARDDLRYVLLTHRNDPVSVVNKATLAFQRPEWLPARGELPNGVPESMRFVPGVSLAQGLVDLMNGTKPIPGRFEAHAHDYRADLPEFVRASYGHDDPTETDHVTDDQVQRITQELVHTERERAAIMRRDRSW